MSDEVAITVDNLSRNFGRVRALDGISLAIARGQVFGFLGPNGAGKTTLIRILLGLVAPTQGRVRVFGYDPMRNGADVRKRSGALLEHAGLYERLTAKQNLEFFARAARMPRASYDARIRELLTRIGLWDRRHDHVGSWSRGMKQKLAVARAVLHRPPLVFLDEPTAGLDPVASASLRDDIAMLSTTDGVTVFLTTHNLSEAERLCAVVGVIRSGRLVATGAPADLRSGSGLARLHIRAPMMSGVQVEQLAAHPDVAAANPSDGGAVVELQTGSSASGVIAWLVGQGIQLEEVKREEGGFESALLDLMRSPDHNTSRSEELRHDL
jgi:ABC-2 type transport system ATP-binding protein